MTFKSLIIFALVASVGRVMAAPLTGRNLGARNPCQGIWCARHINGDGHSDLSRRLAEFDGNNVTLSSGTPPKSTIVFPSSTTSVDPPSPTLDKDPDATPSDDPSSIPSVDPSSTSSSISGGIPQPTDPAAGGPVIITVTSTIFLSSTDPAASLPTQSSSSVSVKPSTVPADGVSSSPGPGLIKPSGIFNSVSSPAPFVSPTVIDLSDGVPSSSISSKPASQPTPSPTPGIIFLPPSDDAADLNP